MPTCLKASLLTVCKTYTSQNNHTCDRGKDVPFLWRAGSGGEGAVEWPSIIHLKRDCGPTGSFTVPGAPTIPPSSSPERLPAAEPNPDRGHE